MKTKWAFIRSFHPPHTKLRRKVNSTFSKWGHRFAVVRNFRNTAWCVVHVATGTTVPRSYHGAANLAQTFGDEVLTTAGREKFVAALRKAKEALRTHA